MSEEKNAAWGSTAQPLRGKRALVTGGAKRIGRSLALALAEAGADVAITYRGSEQEARGTVQDLRAFGGNALALPCDIREETSVRAGRGCSR